MFEETGDEEKCRGEDIYTCVRKLLSHKNMFPSRDTKMQLKLVSRVRRAHSMKSPRCDTRRVSNELIHVMFTRAYS